MNLGDRTYNAMILHDEESIEQNLQVELCHKQSQSTHLLLDHNTLHRERGPIAISNPKMGMKDILFIHGQLPWEEDSIFPTAVTCHRTTRCNQCQSREEITFKMRASGIHPKMWQIHGHTSSQTYAL